MLVILDGVHDLFFELNYAKSKLVLLVASVADIIIAALVSLPFYIILSISLFY